MALSRPLRANNSVGLGGTEPPGRTNRFLLTSEGWTSSIRSVSGLERYWVMPFSLLERWNTLFSPGLRISSPTITTFFPKRERLIARFAETNDFPSPLTVEVTRITFWSLSSINWRLVRILRKVSLIRLFLFSKTAIEPFLSFFSSVNGISPIIGTLVSFSTSARPSILNFVSSIR